MIWHDHVCTDPCSMRRAFLSETQKGFVNWWRRQNVATVLRASGDEVNRRPYEHKIESTQAALPNFGAHRAPLQEVTFTACVCCEDFGMRQLNSPARASNQPTPVLLGWKREMGRSRPATEKPFPKRLRKRTGKDSASGLEWGKGQCFPIDAIARS